MKIEQPATHLDHMIRQTRQHHGRLKAFQASPPPSDWDGVTEMSEK